MFWSACLAFFLVGSCSGGLLRVPKVYNAIINSNDNLTPSRAFPLIQPVVHETALGYPLSPPLLYQPPLLHHLDPNNNPPKPIDPNQPETKQQPNDPSKPTQPPEKDQKPQQPPSNDGPLKLNEFGLPPSLVPVSQYTPYQYNPYHYNPYYPDPFNNVVLPYNNPYNPYYPFGHNPFNPYLVHHPFYNIPPNQQQPEGPPQGWSDQGYGPPQQQPTTPGQAQDQKPEQPGFPPSNLNVKNNSNKNSNIPDVPPPPLPVGGSKIDNNKKPSN